MSSYYVETHRSKRKHPRDLIPATVRRYPVHRVPVAVPKAPPAPPAPASAAPPPPKEEHDKEKAAKTEKTPSPPPSKENPKEPKEGEKAEEKAASEPAPAPAPVPEWSAWQRLEGSQWDGYWRGKAQGDNRWTYQFTRDFTTIWEQKPAEQPETTTNKKAVSSSSSSSSSGASSATTSAGEPPVRTQQPTAAFETTTTILPPLDSPSSSYTVDEDDIIYASYGDVAVATTATHPAAMAVSSAATDLDMNMSGLTLGSLYSTHSQTGRQAQKSRRHKRRHKDKHHDYNHDNDYHYNQQEVDDGTTAFATPFSQEEEATGVASTPFAFAPAPAQKSLGHHHAGSKRGRKTHHGAHSQSKQAHRDSHRLGQIVSREKGKRFDSRKIVESWQFG